jgi:ribosomal protein S24E
MKQEEKQVLFKKFVNEKGMTREEAGIQIKKDILYLKEFEQKLRLQKKTELDINLRLKEEFAKLCGR